jgi:hypothetical protein
LELRVRLERIARVVGLDGVHVVFADAVAKEETSSTRRDSTDCGERGEKRTGIGIKVERLRRGRKIAHGAAQEPAVVIAPDDDGPGLGEQAAARSRVSEAVDDVAHGQDGVDAFFTCEVERFGQGMVFRRECRRGSRTA